jgi:hypothetical protein
VFIMDVQKEVIVIWVFNINACQEHLELLIELAVKMKDVLIVLLVIIALEEQKTSDYSLALVAATALLRLEYL